MIIRSPEPEVKIVVDRDHAAANNALSTYPVVKYTPKFVYGDDGPELVVGDEAGASK